MERKILSEQEREPIEIGVNADHLDAIMSVLFTMQLTKAKVFTEKVVNEQSDYTIAAENIYDTMRGGLRNLQPKVTFEVDIDGQYHLIRLVPTSTSQQDGTTKLATQGEQ